MSKEKPNYPLRRFLTVTALSLVALKGYDVVQAHTNKSAEVTQLETWDKKGPVPLFNGRLVLRQGVALRSEPVMKRADPDLGRRDNIVDRVETGKVLIVDNPIELQAEDGDTWYGFVDATDRTEGSDSDEMADELNWVNATELTKQRSSKGNHYIDVVPASDYSENPTIQADINNGQVLFFSKEGDIPAALGHTVDASNANVAYDN